MCVLSASKYPAAAKRPSLASLPLAISMFSSTCGLSRGTAPARPVAANCRLNATPSPPTSSSRTPAAAVCSTILIDALKSCVPSGMYISPISGEPRSRA